MGVAQEFPTQRRPPGRKPPTAGRNAEVSFHGERRSNETHQSTTDPEARLARKSNATAAKLCYAGHLLMEHRNALLVDAELTEATGYAERATALEMLERLPPMTRRRTIAGDKGYDTKDFVADVRELGFTPHVAPNTTRNARRSTGAPPATPDTPSANGSANGSKNPSAGSRPSPAAASSATSADNETGPGSS